MSASGLEVCLFPCLEAVILHQCWFYYDYYFHDISHLFSRMPCISHCPKKPQKINFWNLKSEEFKYILENIKPECKHLQIFWHFSFFEHWFFWQKYDLFKFFPYFLMLKKWQINRISVEYSLLLIYQMTLFWSTGLACRGCSPLSGWVRVNSCLGSFTMSFPTFSPQFPRRYAEAWSLEINMKQK